MKSTLAFLALGLPLFVAAQGKWMPYAAVEENIHLSDRSIDFNYANLSVPAANAGMRLGASYAIQDGLKADVTLGVTGVGTPGVFSSKIIPIEVMGHYDLLGGTPVSFLTGFTADLGVGSGLAESNAGRFGFSEHFSVGASAEMADVLPFGTLIMGMRFTQFVDDYIDGLQVAGTSNDAMLRFYTAVRLDGGMSQKAKKAIADAESKAKELQSTLTSTLESKEASEKALDQNKKKHAQEKAQLQDEIDALKAQLTAPAPVEEVKVDGIQSPGMYHVIIGSFPTKEAAEAYAASIEGKTPEVDFIESLSTYRVSLSAHDSYAKAAATLEDAKTISSKAWIVQY